MQYPRQPDVGDPAAELKCRQGINTHFYLKAFQRGA